jgi:hypothetical protein
MPPPGNYGQDIPQERQRSKHAVVDHWRDAVIKCRCGATFAEMTMTKARRAYSEHLR